MRGGSAHREDGGGLEPIGKWAPPRAPGAYPKPVDDVRKRAGAARPALRPVPDPEDPPQRRSPAPEVPEEPSELPKTSGRREKRTEKAPAAPRRRSWKGALLWKDARLYWWRRAMLAALVLAVAAGLLVATVARTSSEDASRTLPIEPSSAGPDTVLADVSGASISTPIRPSDLTGIGYHPENEALLGMDPRGENLSSNALFALLSWGSTPQDIKYHVMDRAGRGGPRTGAMDVGAEAGTRVYAPVTGVVSAIRPDPMVPDANVVEIKPADDPDIRVSVTLVREISPDLGPRTPVTAGITELGTVADSASVLEPQLAGYTGDAGNHVTVSAVRGS